MASSRYNSAKVKLARGQFGDLHGHAALKATFHTSTYTPDQDAHDFYNDLTNELAGTGGYTVGGFTLANVTVAQDNTNNAAIISADNIVIPGATIGPFRYIVIRDATTGVAGTEPLILVYDAGSDITANGVSLTIDWDALGVFNIT
jgi:hypothetical protein